MDTDLLRRLVGSGTASRRDFLGIGARLAGLSLLGTLPARRGDATIRTAAYPFSLGVASGDPTPTGVVLWTRLAPEPLAGGGMPRERTAVRWEVAADEGFRRPVRNGEVLALPELGHSVHVELDGLEPARTYWYRFISGGEASPVGRTRTAPAPGAPVERFRFAFASCQHYAAGYYTAYRHMAAEELDLVVHLGDYIYESGIHESAPRQHNGPEILTLGHYRNRYALYKGDPDLQAAHAAFPWIVTPDDHEVDNDYADEIPQDDVPPEVFLLRRAAAYQAYYEHMPLRRSSFPRGPDIPLYRRIHIGGLAEFNVLDTRQYRSDQPCARVVQLPCPAVFDPRRTILGDPQESWLLDGLAGSSATWKVLANQVPVAPVDRVEGPDVGFNMDKWNGYVADRERLLGFIRDRRIANPVVITGDAHRNWLAELKGDLRDASSESLGVEFVGTSISSGGDGADTNPRGEALLRDNPHVKFYNEQRGYVRCTLTPRQWRSDYRVVPFVTRPGAPVGTRASFVMEAGRPGVSPA